MGSSADAARRRGRPRVRGARDDRVEGRADPRTPLRRPGTGAAGLRRHPRRRAGERRGADGARVPAAWRGRRRRGPASGCCPAVNPDGVARGSKNSARDVDLNRNFPARSFATAHAPGLLPRPGAAVGAETRVIAEPAGAGAIAAVVAVHAPFACVNYDGPAAAWAEAVAAACGWPARAGHRLSDPGLARGAGWASIAACPC